MGPIELRRASSPTMPSRPSSATTTRPAASWASATMSAAGPGTSPFEQLSARARRHDQHGDLIIGGANPVHGPRHLLGATGRLPATSPKPSPTVRRLSAAARFSTTSTPAASTEPFRRHDSLASTARPRPGARVTRSRSTTARKELYSYIVGTDSVTRAIADGDLGNLDRQRCQAVPLRPISIDVRLRATTQRSSVDRGVAA